MPPPLPPAPMPKPPVKLICGILTGGTFTLVVGVLVGLNIGVVGLLVVLGLFVVVAVCVGC